MSRVRSRTLKVGALLAALVFALVAGCAGPQQSALFVHPNVDFANYQRIAVLPLENFTSERFAAERVREILNVEFNAQGLFEVIDNGEVNRVLRTQNVVNVAELGPKESGDLGRALGAQALVLGSVMEFQEHRTGTITTPDIALSLRMIDAESGVPVWAVTGAHSGAKLSTRLFGVGEESQTDAVLRLVREVLSTLE